MPRKARKKSESGIYHILMRGINRQTIFEDDDDYSKFVQTLDKYRERSGYEVYAYCLMDNHVHLLLKVGLEPLEQLMRRLCGSYVYWYNTKYQRVGYLFQDRFKSEALENESYFLCVLRYIHQNPIKAGLVESAEKYQWSSMSEYIGKLRMVNSSFALKFFDEDQQKAQERFSQFCKTSNEDHCLEMEDKNQISDKEARSLIQKVCQIENAFELQKIDKTSRNRYLKELKEKYYLSIRQLERLTGINRGVVLKA